MPFADFFREKLLEPTREFVEGAQAAGREYRKWVDPEAESAAAMSGGAIIRGELAAQATRRAIVPAQIAEQNKVEEAVRGGSKPEWRRGYFDNLTRAGTREMTMRGEERTAKQPSSGDLVYDSLLERYYDPYYAHQEDSMRRIGVLTIPAVDNYIYHWIKDAGQKQAFVKQYESDIGTGKPGWAQHRQFRFLRQLRDIGGIELPSYNPETISQGYGASVEAVKGKVRTLKRLEDQGMAFKDRPDLPDEIKGWERVISPAHRQEVDEHGKPKFDAQGNPVWAKEREAYRIHPDVKGVINNAWDTKSLYHNALVGPAMSALRMGKRSTPFVLGWSVVHGRHILTMAAANALTQLQRRVLFGDAKTRGRAFADFVDTAMHIGLTHTPEVDVLQKGTGRENLNKDQKINIQHSLWAGLVFTHRPEERISFFKRLADWYNEESAGAKKAGVGADLALDTASRFLRASWVQNAIFNKLIPRWKFSAFIEARDTLQRLHPDLFRPDNESALRVELNRIGKTIEGRFGEMFYDGLFWKRGLKELGNAALLSQGWQIGFFRVYGGALKDLSVIRSHMIKGMDIKGEMPAGMERDPLLGDRLLFATNYTMLTMLQAGLITYLGLKLSGAQDAMPHGLDWVFPRIGKTPEGKDIRLSPVEFSREIFTIGQYAKEKGWLGAAGHVLMNKLNPVLSSSIQAFIEGKNFYGRPIEGGFLDKLSYVLGNSIFPIPAKQAFQASLRHPQARDIADFWANTITRDTFFSAIGFPIAAAWTGRTDTQNAILAAYIKQRPAEHSQEWYQLQDAVRSYHFYKERGDQGGMNQAKVDILRSAGADKGAKVIAKLDVPLPAGMTYEDAAAIKRFKGLEAQTKVDLLKTMPSEEQKIYVPLLKGHALELWNAYRQQGSPGGEQTTLEQKLGLPMLGFERSLLGR